MVRFRPEDYPDLSPDQIYDLIEERSLDEARLAHKERYGRPCTAKEIGAEIDKLFRNWARGNIWTRTTTRFLRPRLRYRRTCCLDCCSAKVRCVVAVVGQ